MPAGRVIDTNRIYLNGFQYSVDLLEEKESSILPEKQVFGDWTKGSDPYKSQLIIGDFSGGPGQFIHGGVPLVNRAYTSGLQTRYKFWVIPPFPVTDTDDLATPNTAVISGLVASDVVTQGTYLLYAAFGDNIHVMTTADDSWASVQNIAGSQTVSDALHIELGGTGYLIYAHTGGYDYTSDGTAWTADTTYTQIKYLADWDEKLWLIDRDGKLYYCTTIGTEVADAVLRLPRNSVTNLFVGPDANGEPIVYAATTVGLYAHDFANAKFVKTGLELPYNANNGLGSCAWRGKIYFSSNMAVYEFDPQVGTVRSMGLDRDDSLSSDMRGYIKDLEPSLTDLVALVDCSAATSGKTGIYGWDEQAWEAKFVESGNKWAADDLLVSSQVGSYRIWHAIGIGGASPNRKVRYQSVPTERVHPSDISGYAFNSTNNWRILITPWYTLGQDNIDKIALALKLDWAVSAGSPTVAVDLQRDWGATWYSIGSPTTPPPAAGRIDTYTMPPASIDANNPGIGLAFRAMRFRIQLTPAQDNWPIFKSLTLEYIPKLRLKRQWSVVIDMNETVNGQSPKAQRDNLETVLGSQTLSEFTYRDEAGFFVLAFQDKTTVITGKDERGTMSLLLVEP